MNLTLDDILKATGGKKISGSDHFVVTRISTDTRTLQKGDFYIPLKGINFDGHDFLQEAFQKGAVGAMVNVGADPCVRPVLGSLMNGEGGHVGPPLQIVVPDTLKALGDIAHFWRKKFSIPVVGLTGSNGKTTTKEMMASILSVSKNVLKNEGNLNNLIGLPLTLFKLNEKHEVAILEMGMNAFGEIKRLAEIAEPTVALITNVGAAHLEGVGGNLEGVAKAKGELFLALDPKAIALVNQNDPYISKMPTKAKKLTYGLDCYTDVLGKVLSQTSETTQLKVTTPKGDFVFSLPFIGGHLISDFLGAMCVALTLDFSFEDIQTGIKNFLPPKMRGEEVRLDDDILVINDAYNANPDSMKAALKHISSKFPERRKIAVLGDMLELGNLSSSLHVEVGREVAHLGYSCLLAYGNESENYKKGFGEGFSFSKMEDLEKELKKRIKPGDVILVKGSRGSKMERIVYFLVTGQ